jgi:hypothetical protein
MFHAHWLFLPEITLVLVKSTYGVGTLHEEIGGEERK